MGVEVDRQVDRVAQPLLGNSGDVVDLCRRRAGILPAAAPIDPERDIFEASAQARAAEIAGGKLDLQRTDEGVRTPVPFFQPDALELLEVGVSVGRRERGESSADVDVEAGEVFARNRKTGRILQRRVDLFVESRCVGTLAVA